MTSQLPAATGTFSFSRAAASTGSYVEREKVHSQHVEVLKIPECVLANTFELIPIQKPANMNAKREVRKKVRKCLAATAHSPHSEPGMYVQHLKRCEPFKHTGRQIG